MKQTVAIIMLFLGMLTSPSHAEKKAEFPDILKAESIQVDRDQLIVTQENLVSLYSLTDYHHITDFARRGEGPGELKQSAIVHVLPDSLMTFSRGKVLWFSRQGNLLREVKVSLEYRDIRPVSNHFLGIQEINTPQQEASIRRFSLLNGNFEKSKDLYETANNVSIGRDGVHQEFSMLSHTLDAAVADDRIFIADSSKGFFITVFDSQGKSLYTIQKKGAPQRVTDAFKREMSQALRSLNQRLWTQVKDRLSFPEFYPALRSFFRADGKIFVTSYLTREKKHQLITLDHMGKIIKDQFIELPSWRIFPYNVRQRDLFTIHEGKVYELVDNPDREVYELHVREI